MILYPTNALVEDQLSRLRGAVARLRSGANPVDVWFGRYNGSTPGMKEVPAGKATEHRVAVVAADIRAAERDRTYIAEHADDSLLDQFPSALAGETRDTMGHRRNSTRHPRDELLDAQRHADARHRGPVVQPDGRVASLRSVERLHPRRRRASTSTEAPLAPRSPWSFETSPVG